MIFHKENDFAETPFGDFPKDWRIVSLGDIAKVKGGKRVTKGEKLVDLKTGFPYIRIVDFKNGIVDVSGVKYLLPETREKIKKYTISSNDVYISIAGTIGLAGLIPPELDGANLTENAAKLCDLKDVRKEFLAYLLNSDVLKDQIMGLIGRGTQPKLALFRIEGLKIPLPSFGEQGKIAEILGVVDSAIGLVDRVIWKTERLKKGLMQTLLTKGIGHTEYKDTPIGKTPKTWQIVRLSNIGDIATGKTPSTSNTAYWNGKIPFITPADIKESKHVYETERYVTSEGAKCVGGILPRDTVLAVCIGSTIGKTAITFEESVTNQQINSIICKKDVAEPDYVYYALSLRANLLKSYSGIAAVPIVKKSLFEQFKIPLPLIPEQQRIAETLSAIGQKLELERKEKMSLERVKRGLMNLLLNGKVRVKAD